MAFPYDVDETNQALGRLGYAPMGTTAPAAAREAPPPPPVASPTPSQAVATAPAAPAAPAAPTNDPGTPKADGSDTQTSMPMKAMGAAQQGINMLPPEKKDDGLQRLGALVGTAMSVYTGNYAGAAQGLSGLSGGK